MLDEKGTEMMNVRWKIFCIHAQIPWEKQEELRPGGKCFATLILEQNWDKFPLKADDLPRLTMTIKKPRSLYCLFLRLIMVNHSIPYDTPIFNSSGALFIAFIRHHVNIVYIWNSDASGKMKEKFLWKETFHCTSLNIVRMSWNSVLDVTVYITRNSEVFFTLMECTAYQYLICEPFFVMIASILLFIDAIVLSIKVP